MTDANVPVLSHRLGPNDWATKAREFASSNEKAVLVFVVRHYGSTPRDQGSWILVRPDMTYGTLGGGEVERVVEAAARDMLAGRRIWKRAYEKFMLGPDMGQCCGGGMEVVFEPISSSSLDWLDQAQQSLENQAGGFVIISWKHPEQVPSVHSTLAPENMETAGGVHVQSLVDQRPQIVIYGAGHVARAFAAIAAQLPVRLSLVDDRPAELDQVPLAPNVSTVFMEYPVSHAETLDDRTSAVLVMTYSHALDYRLCLALLKKPELKYIGLIGSNSKGARFRRRFEMDDGLSTEEISRLVSPIGQGPVSGKEPGLIALASLNEILAVLNGAALDQQIYNKETS